MGDYRIVPTAVDLLAPLVARLAGPDKGVAEDVAAALTRRDHDLEDRLSALPFVQAGVVNVLSPTRSTFVNFDAYNVLFTRQFDKPPVVVVSILNLPGGGGFKAVLAGITTDLFGVFVDNTGSTGGYQLQWTATERTDV